jgi:hypothetical protein
MIESKFLAVVQFCGLLALVGSHGFGAKVDAFELYEWDAVSFVELADEVGFVGGGFVVRLGEEEELWWLVLMALTHQFKY